MRMPLEGIRILEWAVYHAGPAATGMLCDLGAEVIKIEQPGTGDHSRQTYRYKGIDFSLPDGTSMFYAAPNRGKKSVTLNLEHPEGRQIAYNLAKKSDIFFTNLRRSTVAKMKMSYKDLSPLNPQLIYASVTSYGTKGPDADMGGFDSQGQGRSGMMWAFGEPGMPPFLGQFGIVDQATAVMGSYEMVVALLARERLGVGQEVDVSLLGTAAYLMYYNYLIVLLTGREVPRHEQANADPMRNYYQCQDGKWVVQNQPPKEENWKAMCEIIGHPELIQDPRYDTREKRINRSEELVPIFGEVFATKSGDEWIKLFRERKLVMCAVNTVTEAIGDPQMTENSYIVDFEHRDLGRIKIPGFPVHFSKTCVNNNLAAPKLGEHTEMVLKEIGGYSDDDIYRFRRDNVI